MLYDDYTFIIEKQIVKINSFKHGCKVHDDSNRPKTKEKELTVLNKIVDRQKKPLFYLRHSLFYFKH
jgi:hypothetical protein